LPRNLILVWEAPATPPLGPPPVAPGDPAAPSPVGPSGWSPWTAPAALFAVLAAALLGGALVAIVGVVAGADLDNPPASVNIAATAVQDFAMVAVAFVFARLSGVGDAAQLGLRMPNWRHVLGWMTVTWLGFLVFSAAWVSALGIGDRQDVPDELGADQSSIALAGVAILVTVLAPICEEVFFRGFFFRTLRNWRGPWIAATVTGLVFGAVHAFGSPVGFLVPLAVFGFGLCMLYWRTGSLLPCIAVHALNNSLALGVAQHWDWQIPLLMLGSVAVNAAIVLPVVRAARRTPAPA
jgi:membrane protease YdiL (CAAX protease family)